MPSSKLDKILSIVHKRTIDAVYSHSQLGKIWGDRRAIKKDKKTVLAVLAALALFVEKPETNSQTDDALKVVYPIGLLNKERAATQIAGPQKFVYRFFEKILSDHEVVSWPYNRAYIRYKEMSNVCLMAFDKQIMENEVVSQPLGQSTYRLYRHVDGPRDIKKVGVIQRGNAFADPANPALEVHYAQQISDLVGWVIRGRVDAIVLGKRSEELGIMEKYNLVDAGAEALTLNHKLHCHNTPQAQNLIKMVNNQITDLKIAATRPTVLGGH